MSYEASRMPFSAMVTGFRQALQRFKASNEGTDPVAASLPLFEALSWAVALDERVKKDWAPDGIKNQPGWDWAVRLSSEADAEAVRGVRFIRNRIHHQWADAVRIEEGGSRYSPRTFEWVWVRADELPPPDKGFGERGREGYERLLEGRPAEFTLAILIETYDFLVGIFEPLGPPPHWRPTDQSDQQPR